MNLSANLQYFSLTAKQIRSAYQSNRPAREETRHQTRNPGPGRANCQIGVPRALGPRGCGFACPNRLCVCRPCVCVRWPRPPSIQGRAPSPSWTDKLRLRFSFWCGFGCFDHGATPPTVWTDRRTPAGPERSRQGPRRAHRLSSRRILMCPQGMIGSLWTTGRPFCFSIKAMWPM